MYIKLGSLIDRKHVITAAHCILSNFDYLYGDQIYTINLTTSSFYPTLESCYKVFVGADNLIVGDTNIKPAKVVSVSKVIRVRY
jgi:hypothetical protein